MTSTSDPTPVGLDDPPEGETRLELYLRAETPLPEHRAALVERAERLRADGRVDAVAVRTWPGRASVSGSPDDDEPARTVSRFESWAAEHGVSLRPGFERRRRETLLGETDEVIVTPLACLAVVEDDALVGVYPHTDGGDVSTVDDALSALESAPPQESTDPAGPVAAR